MSAPVIAKSWAFTKNNWTLDDLTFFTEWPDFNYMVIGRETAPTTGTKHLQGYFTLKKAVRPSYLKRTLPKGTHFEVARQSAAINVKYCSKSGNYSVIDRRYNRPGTVGCVTESPISSPAPSPQTIDNLVTHLMPKLRISRLLRK